MRSLAYSASHIRCWVVARVADLPRAAEFETVAQQLAGPDQVALAKASLAACLADQMNYLFL